MSFTTQLKITKESQVLSDDFIFGHGHTTPNKIYTWNPDRIETMNPHALICGLSGAGKTTLLKQFVRYLQNKEKDVYLIDLHGDLELPDENHIEFTAWDAKYGINPFEFDKGVSDTTLLGLIQSESSGNFFMLSDEQERALKNSGPIVQIREIIDIFKKNFIQNMGAKQESLLKALLLDTYKLKGIVHDDYRTWINALPSVEDLRDLIIEVENAFATISNSLGSTPISVANINAIYRSPDEGGHEGNSGLFIKGKEVPCVRKSDLFVSNNIDPAKYFSKDSMRSIKSLQFYIENLIESKVFHSETPPFTSGLNRINISGLRHDIQMFMSDILINKVFRMCKARGEYSKLANKPSGTRTDTYVIVDEGKLIIPSGKEKNNPFSYLNRIVTESRKYGLGTIIAVQSPAHLPDEFLRNIYMQVILTTNEADYDVARRVFNLYDKELLRQAKDWGVALVKTKAGFFSVRLPWYEGVQ
ncbi:MAG TPA: hypothetical protein DCM31_04610 [Deferribacteraceae bacterium]|nr:hypothetical protein [Deferribacteraceae bacterium]